MTTVNMHRAKTELSSLVARAEAGEEIIIARRNMPVAKIVPIPVPIRKVRKPGALSHLRGKLPDTLFLEKLSEEELQAWEGEFSFNED